MTPALDEFVRTGSQSAFREVMLAHMDLVYTVALRQVRDHHLAEDVTQAVFVILARKAPRVGPNRPLGGWLVNAARLAARDALKLQSRRRRHEAAAVERPSPSSAQSVGQPVDDSRGDLVASIDSALGRLNRDDRDIIVLRYYQTRTHREIASQLAITEEAAKKRLARAIDRLKKVIRPLSVEQMTGALGALGVGGASRSLQMHFLGGQTTPSALARQVASQVLRRPAYKLAIVGTVAAVSITVVVGYTAAVMIRKPTATAATTDASPIHPVADPNLAGYPIAFGWPVALPGSISGTPIVADLERPGEHCLVVACMADRTYVNDPPVHPQPDRRPLVFAFHPDGSLVDGYPLALDPDVVRDRSVFWSSHPTVVPADESGQEGIVIVSPAGKIDFIRSGRAEQVGEQAGAGASIAVLSRADDLASNLTAPVGNGLAVVWPAPRVPATAGCSVGHLYGNQWLGTVAAISGPPRVVALSHLGGVLPGWPRATLQECTAAPALGDLDGDGRLETCAIDRGGHLYLWHVDGTPVAGTHRKGAVEGIFRDNIYSESTPTLIDVDGDGRAELFVFDTNSHALFAWRGDGTGLVSADGLVARLPQQRGWGGVSVAHLGEAASVDCFVGTTWVHLDAGRRVTVKPLLPEWPATTTWCTVTNLIDDKTADILFGTSGGRVYVYRTDQPWLQDRPSWPTAGGNSRHTGLAQ